MNKQSKIDAWAAARDVVWPVVRDAPWYKKPNCIHAASTTVIRKALAAAMLIDATAVNRLTLISVMNAAHCAAHRAYVNVSIHYAGALRTTFGKEKDKLLRAQAAAIDKHTVEAWQQVWHDKHMLLFGDDDAGN